MTRAELEQTIAGIAGALREALATEQPRVGFCLLLFDYGETGSFAYAADAERADVVELLEEAIIKIRGESARAGRRA